MHYLVCSCLYIALHFFFRSIISHFCRFVWFFEEFLKMPPGQKQEEEKPERAVVRPQFVRRESAWRVHEFEVAGRDGAALCRAALVRLPAALLLWLGARGDPLLGAVALGVPPPAGGGAGPALASLLVHGDGRAAGAAEALARRLAVRLARPVHVSLGASFDRLLLPLVERALSAEMARRPDLFALPAAAPAR